MACAVFYCREGSSRERSSKMMEQQISLLMTTGLLTRNVAAQGSYLFAVPGAGRLVTSIAKGRKVCLPFQHP